MITFHRPEGTQEVTWLHPLNHARIQGYTIKNKPSTTKSLIQESRQTWTMEKQQENNYPKHGVCLTDLETGG